MSNAIGPKLKALRMGCAYSLTELSRITGISRTYLHVIEKGESDPTLDMCLRLADAFGVTINTLVYESDETEPFGSPVAIGDESRLLQYWRTRRWADLLAMIATAMKDDADA